MGLICGVSVCAAPANDLFANRLSVVGNVVTMTGNVAEATSELGEPSIADNAGRSLWWTWTPAEDGLLQLSGQGIISLFDGETFSTLRLLRTEALFRQSPVGGWSPPVVLPGSPGAWISGLIPVRAGVAYQVRLDSNECTFRPPSNSLPIPRCQAMGTDLRIEFVVYPVASDSFAGRKSVAEGVTLLFTRNDDAATEPGEPANPSGAGRSVWWSWTAPATGRYTVDRIGELLAAVSFFRGDQLSSLERVADLQVTPLIVRPWPSPPSLTFAIRSGEVLALRGDALPGQRTNAPIAFRILPLMRPENDDLSNAIVLTNLTTSSTVDVTVDVAGATPEQGERVGAARSTWWRWTAPASGGWAIVRSKGTSIESTPPRIAAHRGDQITNLVTLTELLPTDADSRFTADAGQSYLISLDQRDNLGQMHSGFRLVHAPDWVNVGNAIWTDGSSGTGISFPVTVAGGDRIAAEFSTSLDGWSPLQTEQFDQSGTYWFGPFPQPGVTGFFRFLRRNVSQ
jgi:hypothetical protein